MHMINYNQSIMNKHANKNRHCQHS